MSGTDEFIVFATKAEISDDGNDDENNTNNTDQLSPTTINRGSLNRLYTFSRPNDDNTINNSKKLPSNQVCIIKNNTYIYEIFPQNHYSSSINKLLRK